MLTNLLIKKAPRKVLKNKIKWCIGMLKKRLLFIFRLYFLNVIASEKESNHHDKSLMPVLKHKKIKQCMQIY